MNHTAPHPSALIREIPLSCLALAPENVRKTPANEFAQAELVASIQAHGLLENLVARADDPDPDGTERFAVVAGGRRLAALKALAENGTLDADHPVPCKIAANGNAGELSLAENVIRIAMHPADRWSRSPISPSPASRARPSPRASVSPSAWSSSGSASVFRMRVSR